PLLRNVLARTNDQSLFTLTAAEKTTQQIFSEKRCQSARARLRRKCVVRLRQFARGQHQQDLFGGQRRRGGKCYRRRRERTFHIHAHVVAIIPARCSDLQQRPKRIISRETCKSLI